uniref:CYSTM domain-containing protein n=1 Tax=Caenorhabditis tropicalis TaxID=1561998 RepID=A0A1I7US01_9PELO
MQAPPPYTSIAQTVTAQPQPQYATFLPFQSPPRPEPKKPCKCCAPCCLLIQICGCLAEVCFALCDCREI